MCKKRRLRAAFYILSVVLGLRVYYFFPITNLPKINFKKPPIMLGNLIHTILFFIYRSKYFLYNI